MLSVSAVWRDRQNYEDSDGCWQWYPPRCGSFSYSHRHSVIPLFSPSLSYMYDTSSSLLVVILSLPRTAPFHFSHSLLRFWFLLISFFLYLSLSTPNYNILCAERCFGSVGLWRCCFWQSRLIYCMTYCTRRGRPCLEDGEANSSRSTLVSQH